MIAATLLASVTALDISPLALPLAELSGTTKSLAWGLLIFFVILGAMITLSPSRRTSEIKRTKDD
jgi:hypothetical protein